jgi:hypothetical protein
MACRSTFRLRVARYEYILTVCTVGTWIHDLAASTAPIEHQFVGTDINASNFPANPPKAQTYFAQDINKPWPEEWKNSFDFVHQRLALVGSGPAAQQAVANLAALVKPGGWIQLIEATNDLPEETGPAMRNFVTIMKGMFSTYGASLSLGNDLPGLVTAAGFENVQDRVVMTKLGAANPKPKLAAQGIYSTGVAAVQLSKAASSECYISYLSHTRCAVLICSIGFPEGHIPLSAAQVEGVPKELKVELTERLSPACRVGPQARCIVSRTPVTVSVGLHFVDLPYITTFRNPIISLPLNHITAILHVPLRPLTNCSDTSFQNRPANGYREYKSALRPTASFRQLSGFDLALRKEIAQCS